MISVLSNKKFLMKYYIEISFFKSLKIHLMVNFYKFSEFDKNKVTPLFIV